MTLSPGDPLAFDDDGAGPAVLLIHSTVADRRMWRPQTPALTAAGYRAIRCDLPGHGDSPMPTHRYDTAADITALLDRLGVERTALVGASGGGRVALEIAARWPARISALALLATALDGHQPSDALQAFASREDDLLEAGDVAGATELNLSTWLGPSTTLQTRDNVREMQRHAFDVQLAGDDSVAPVDVPHLLTAITAPSLLVAGAHDLPDFRDIAARLAHLLPAGRYVELDWAGHLPSLERPNEINSLLLDFLSSAA